MNALQRGFIKWGMQAVLRLTAALARRHEGASLALMRWLARRTVRARRITPAPDLPALGLAWQRGFASAKQVPIVALEVGTVHAEIRTPCPLRGSGDTLACWRMMAYDREVAAAAGGSFVVLRSQAEPGVTVCEVALRRAGERLDDLVPAHVRAPRRRPV